MFPEAESILIGRPALPSYKKRCWAATGCGAVGLWGYELGNLWECQFRMEGLD